MAEFFAAVGLLAVVGAVVLTPIVLAWLFVDFALKDWDQR